MILTKELEISINRSNINHFKQLGYDNLFYKKRIIIPIEHLKSRSHAIITVRCDVCNKKKEIKYYLYKKNFDNGQLYCCSLKCSTKKTKINNLKKYGVESFFQTNDFKEKYKKTSMSRYGVENPSQDEKIFIKTQTNAYLLKLHESTNLCYRGTYEKHFLDFCFDNKIPIEKGKTIKYSFNEKSKVYFSDFYLKSKNLIIEIKSCYTYNKDLEKNLVKQQSCLEQEYDFIFIIDKDYNKFKNFLNL